MGKPYASELSRLADTYAWAMGVPVDDFARALRPATAVPLVAVGSGGSFTTAQFAAAAHRQYGATLATAMTPLEIVSTPMSFRGMAAMLITAGGKNPDVLGAFRRLLALEPRRFSILCASTHSPLAGLAADEPFVDVAELALPAGKDGFLATNSLIGSAVFLGRSYAAAFTDAQPFPASFHELLGPASGTSPIEATEALCRPLWQRRTLVVLHGPLTYAAAVDLESKFTEAALGAVQVADYRNFAHGRHHWLAKRGEETAVLGLVTDEDRDLAEATLDLLPGDIPVARLTVPHRGLSSSLAALVYTLMVVGSAGRARGIDPGDPGVPAFGRKIYHMRRLASGGGDETSPLSVEAASIERKAGATISALVARGQLGPWRTAYDTFLERLRGEIFRAVVLDYDGTLCSEAHRFEPLPRQVCFELERLLSLGAVLGVATGRGKSVKESLRGALPQLLWDRVVVGYYNGGDIGLLGDDGRPDGAEAVASALEPVAAAFRADPWLMNLGRLTFRRPQITIEPGPEAMGDHLWAYVQQLIYGLKVPGVMALRSSHSMDIVAPGVCKRAVIARVSEFLGVDESPILSIGDRGLWPGNDFTLLGGPFSLSVDEVSPDPRSCWNLAAPGTRGVAATLHYLRRLEPCEGGLRLAADVNVRRRR